MGAWGAGAFDNDDACDWVDDLENVRDLSIVRDALRVVIETAETYLELPEASSALAACEVIASLRGNRGDTSHSQTVDRWVQANPHDVPPDLIEAAVAAIDRILGPASELRELWEEAESGEWIAAVTDLRSRVV